MRPTLDYWLDHPADETTGRLRYVISYPSLMADANPSVLFAAWCYIEAGGDDRLAAAAYRTAGMGRTLHGAARRGR